VGVAVMPVVFLLGRASPPQPSQLREIFAEAEEAHDLNWQFSSLHALIHVKAYQGDEQGYRATAEAAVKFADDLGGFSPGVCQGAIAADPMMRTAPLGMVSGAVVGVLTVFAVGLTRCWSG
jgi:hypothetical protein